MSRYLDIAKVADEVLAGIEADTEKTAAISAETATEKTVIAGDLKKVANKLRAASTSDLDYSDIQSVLQQEKTASSVQEKPVTGLTPLSCEIRKLANTVRRDGHVTSEVKKLAASHVINAAIGMKHLTETLK